MAATMVARKVLGVAAGAAAGAACTPVASVVYNAELHRKCSGFLSLSSCCSSSVVPGLGLGLELRRRRRKWTSTSSRRRSENGGVVAMVAVPFRPLTLPTEEPGAAEDNDDDYDEKREFDPSAIPPFTLADIRAAIPKHCWEKNVWKSMSFVARDVAIVFGLAAGAAYLNTWFVWPLYWLAQGTMFWALFVLGHDCGHGSFSNDKNLNSLVGHLTHSSILVPYHGWRVSHRTHHQNHGHVEKDESWHPISESIYKDMDFWAKTGRLSFPWAMLAYPFYLWSRSPGKKGSHFDPKSDLFVPNEAKDVMTSTACWTAMLATLVGLTFIVGPMWMLKLYVVPYWPPSLEKDPPTAATSWWIYFYQLSSGLVLCTFAVNVVWLDAVTYLHHHGYEKKVPWYRGMEWNYMRGGLSTIDRDYGWFNNIHHDIGTHVVHHLFPQIPHYHLIEATEAIKPVLGQYYRDPKKSGPIPLHLVEPLLTSLKEDHYVSDSGDIVFYQTDPEFSLATLQNISEGTPSL